MAHKKLIPLPLAENADARRARRARSGLYLPAHAAREVARVQAGRAARRAIHVEVRHAPRPTARGAAAIDRYRQIEHIGDPTGTFVADA